MAHPICLFKNNLDFMGSAMGELSTAEVPRQLLTPQLEHTQNQGIPVGGCRCTPFSLIRVQILGKSTLTMVWRSGLHPVQWHYGGVCGCRWCCPSGIIRLRTGTVWIWLWCDGSKPNQTPDCFCLRPGQKAKQVGASCLRVWLLTELSNLVSSWINN